MSEPLLGESTAQDEQAEVIPRPSISEGHFWINPHRTGSDLLGGSSAKQRVNLKRGLWLRQRLARTRSQARER
jgi:hypothetical protein